MILLDRFLKKSKAPYTQADITELLQLYGPQLKLLTRANGKGELGAFALLSAPMRMLGRTVCNVVAAGTDGTLDARALFEELKREARNLGVEYLMAATFRNPEAVAKRFGATIDSVNLRWDLREAETVGRVQKTNRNSRRRTPRRLREVRQVASGDIGTLP